MTPSKHIQNGPYEDARIRYSKYITQDVHLDIRHYKALILKYIMRPFQDRAISKLFPNYNLHIYVY